LRCGFAFAHRHGYERVVQVDADLQHDPRRIPDLLQAADQTGAQLLIGSRFAGQRYPISFTRRLLMRILARYVNRLVHTQLDDVTSGFRVISQPLLSRFADAYPSDYLGDTVEAILLAGEFGATIAQVPAAMSTRTAGRGTTGFQAAGYLLRTGLALAIGSWRTRSRQLGT
ncbi:MAG: glycosyltransferase family 2 protein, partial [Acidimicrobiia bacterium]